MAQNVSGSHHCGIYFPNARTLPLAASTMMDRYFFGRRHRGGKGGEGGEGGEGGNRDEKMGSNWGAKFDAERAKRCFHQIQKHHVYSLQPAQLARQSELRRVSKQPYSSGVDGEQRR